RARALQRGRRRLDDLLAAGQPAVRARMARLRHGRRAQDAARLWPGLRSGRGGAGAGPRPRASTSPTGVKEKLGMSTHATGTFEGKSWNEQPYDEPEGRPKLARASVSNAFHGDVEGESTLEYLMLYRDGGSASFVGL